MTEARGSNSSAKVLSQLNSVDYGIGVIGGSSEGIISASRCTGCGVETEYVCDNSGDIARISRCRGCGVGIGSDGGSSSSSVACEGVEINEVYSGKEMNFSIPVSACVKDDIATVR